jgi:hypothetical protein
MAFPIVALIGAIGSILDKVIPDPQKAAEAKIKLAELAAKGESDELAALVAMTQAQTDILKIDAASDSFFQKGWRPMAAWTCVVVGFIYPLVRVVVPWVLQVSGVAGIPELPALDSGEMIAMLTGMLGLGTMRSIERQKGKA